MTLLEIHTWKIMIWGKNVYLIDLLNQIEQRDKLAVLNTKTFSVPMQCHFKINKIRSIQKPELKKN